MVKNFLVSMFAILLFTLGGAASWFYVQMVQTNAGDEVVDEQPFSPAAMSPNPDPIPPKTEEPLKTVLRGPALSPEELYRFTTATAKTRKQMREEDERLRNRRLRIRAADADTKAAQREVEGMLNEVRGLMRQTEELATEAEEAIQKLQNTDAEIKRQSEDLNKLKTDLGATEASRLKTFAEYLQSMPPESSAKAFKAMVNEGKMDYAIQLLRQIEPRNVSKILDQIGDPELIAQFATRYPIAPTAPTVR